MEALLATGAPVDGRDRDGSTALSWPAAAGRLDVAATLLDRGADVEAVFPLGGTPMTAAAIGRHADMVELLVRHGGRVDGPEWSGVTPASSRR